MVGLNQKTTRKKSDITIYVVGGSSHLGQYLYKRSKGSNSPLAGAIWTHCGNNLPYTVGFDLESNPLTSILGTLSDVDSVLLLSGITEPSEVYTREHFAKRINLEATQQFLGFVLERGAKLFFFSSVEVFDGTSTPINEYTQTNSLNAYGKMKESNEKLILDMFPSGKFSILRTPWIVNPVPGSRCIVSQTAKGIIAGEMKFADNYLISLVSAEQVWQNLQILLNEELMPLPPRAHFVSRGFISRYELACHIGKKLLNAKYPIHLGRFEDLALVEPRSRDTRMISKVTWHNPFTKPEDIFSVIHKQIETLKRRREIVY